MPKLLLLDGHSLAYRAFYALPTDLATKGGTVTNAVYGFTSMLTKVMADEQPDHIAVAFDAPGGSTYRNELDAEYKAGRKETPDLFRSQLPLIREVLEALEIVQLEVPGVEADDVIATLATQAAEQGMDVVIVTGDRDSYQLVHDPHIKVLYNKRGVSDYALYDEAGIAERCLGVTPTQYLDYASLRGDTSDNLPGVPGIGEKTAAKLIVAYGGLEGIYEHLDDLPPKQRANLAEAQDRVFKNREMSRLTRDVDLEGITPADLRQGAFDRERVRVLFNQLEFRLLLPRILDAIGDVAETPEADTLEVDVAIARDAKAAAESIRAAGNGDRVAIEARWPGAAGRAAPIGIAISTGDDATYIDGDLLADAAVLDALGAIDGPDSPPLVVHRAKELMHGLGRELQSLERDTAVMAYLLDPGEGKYQLEDLALRYLSLELTSPDQVEGTLDFDGEAIGRET
ncbi:MAG: polymerase, partial [Actinomycetota bacterium]|nr:polymerase [Actinomycetota bacterium]